MFVISGYAGGKNKHGTISLHYFIVQKRLSTASKRIDTCTIGKRKIPLFLSLEDGMAVGMTVSDKKIPEDIEQFIFEKIDSVAEMEALLLLRSKPEESWSIESLAKRLYITEDQTAKTLDHLCREGLLAFSSNEHPGYRYQPKSLELQNSVDRVAEMYTKHLVPISNLIHSKPRARVQEFADAFRLRKDK